MQFNSTTELSQLHKELEEDALKYSPAQFHLTPGLIPEGTVKEWNSRNRTLKTAMNPAGNELAIHVGGQKAKELLKNDSQLKAFEQDQQIHIVAWNRFSQKRRPFINTTYGIFRLFQTLNSENQGESENGARDEYQAKLDAHTISQYYSEAIKNHLVLLQSDGSDKNASEVILFEGIYTIWNLCEVL
ncbi:hypothetical protein K7432_016130, partial [Basidiobolus ranarum]